MGEATTSGSQASSSAIDREHERMRLAREADQRAQAEINQRVAEAREEERRRYGESEQGATRAQQAEAERIMRLPTPQALEEIGAVVGDPTKGPSS